MKFRKRLSARIPLPSDFSSGRTPDKNTFFVTTLTEIMHNVVLGYLYIIHIPVYYIYIYNLCKY